MKRIVLGASALALLSGIAIGMPSAEAAPYKRHAGNITHSERVAIARSQARLNAVKRQARRNGSVNFWERAKIRMAQSRHTALVYRLRHN
jgi:hypothetical protein